MPPFFGCHVVPYLLDAIHFAQPPRFWSLRYRRRRILRWFLISLCPYMMWSLRAFTKGSKGQYSTLANPTIHDWLPTP